jgi:carbamoyltransferase
MNGAYLGPGFDDEESAKRLTAAGARFTRLDDSALIGRAVADLAEGRALGWFQGRMEFGPRALGNRSIIADGRSPVMQSRLNLKIKYRESFRPFAGGAAQRRIGLVRARRRQSIHAVDRQSPRTPATADDGRTAGAVRN